MVPSIPMKLPTEIAETSPGIPLPADGITLVSPLVRTVQVPPQLSMVSVSSSTELTVPRRSTFPRLSASITIGAGVAPEDG